MAAVRCPVASAKRQRRCGQAATPAAEPLPASLAFVAASPVPTHVSWSKVSQCAFIRHCDCIAKNRGKEARRKVRTQSARCGPHHVMACSLSLSSFHRALLSNKRKDKLAGTIAQRSLNYIVPALRRSPLCTGAARQRGDSGAQNARSCGSCLSPSSLPFFPSLSLSRARVSSPAAARRLPSHVSRAYCACARY